jgi:hypothetical protein
MHLVADPDHRPGVPHAAMEHLFVGHASIMAGREG